MLSDWIQKSRQNIVIRNDVRNHINRWKEKKSTDELLTGSTLEKALELKKDKDSVFNQVLDGFNEEENKFINISQRRRDRQRYRSIALATLVSTLALLSATLFILFGTDFVARHFDKWGDEELQAGPDHSRNAIDKYTIAIMLKPDKDHVPFLMNRGKAYEVSGNFNYAAADYEAAKTTNPNYAMAYNELARLYIHTKDYDSAVKLLTTGLNLNVGSGLDKVELQVYENVESAMHKNLGWAQFRLADINNAEINLRKAIELDDKSKLAYCLLAQVLAVKNPKFNAKNEWGKCINIPGDPTLPEERGWLDMAKEHLKIN
jgi:tetratricopeptide (TPR) repeat protein